MLSAMWFFVVSHTCGKITELQTQRPALERKIRNEAAKLLNRNAQPKIGRRFLVVPEMTQ
jgi:hypothetical protein